MIRTIVLYILSFMSLGFGALVISRINMDYNEEGRYFDGMVVYDKSELEIYSLITFLSLTVLLAVVSFWKKSPSLNAKFK